MIIYKISKFKKKKQILTFSSVTSPLCLILHFTGSSSGSSLFNGKALSVRWHI